MEKPIKDKAIKSRDDIKKISKKQKFLFPEKGVTIEADNLEEAIKILEAKKSNPK